MHTEARRFVNHFKTAKKISVIEIGSRNVNGTIRDLFPNATWIGLDRAPGPCVDVVGDAERYQPVEPVDVVICCEVLEHANNWRALIQCAASWLKPDGIFIMTCAGSGRKPHSAVDGGPLRPDEYYRNLPFDEISGAMQVAGFESIADGSSGNDTRVCGRLAEVPHIMCVQMAYTDEALSRRRLEISRHTFAPSIEFQTRKPIVHAAVSHHDPLLTERVAMLTSLPTDVRIIYIDSWELYGGDWKIPTGRKVVSRMDDDDVISADFCQVVYHSGCHSIHDVALLWPSGYVWWRSTAYRLVHPGNQFVSLVTSEQTTPHDECHLQYRTTWPSRVVSNNPGWIWVRHGDAHTRTKRKYRMHPVSRIDAARIPINLRAIDRAIAESGPAAGSYAGQA
jgi:hypothetical protein